MDIDTPVLAMDWLPGKGNQEILALACSDGSFKLVSRAGRIEKSVGEANSALDGAELAASRLLGRIPRHSFQV